LDEQSSFLNGYFEDLVDLSIYGHQNNIPELNQAVHRAWQTTNYKPGTTAALPGLNIVKKAFDSLPITDPLLQYLILFYSYEWTTSTYSSIEDYVPMGPGFEKFLYGVALTRCWSLTGLGDVILQHWCQFHEHETMYELRTCEAERDKIIDPNFKKELKNLYDKFQKLWNMSNSSPEGPRVDAKVRKSWLKPKEGEERKDDEEVGENSRAAGKRKAVVLDSDDEAMSLTSSIRSGRGGKKGVAKRVKKS